jgi:hypothetical protein
MKFEKLKPGMVIWDVHSYTMGHTKVRSVGCWAVKIVEVHEDRSITASWNGNQPKRIVERHWRKFRAKKPELVLNSLGAAKIKTRTATLARPLTEK